MVLSSSYYHTELSTYIRCNNTQKLIDGIVSLCESEGMRQVDTILTPLRGMEHISNVANKSNYWAMAILKGREGWSLLLSIPQDLWCERPDIGEQNRFVKLCKLVQAEGFILNAHYHDSTDVEACKVFFEVDSDGECAISGYDNHHYINGDKVENWNGYLFPQGKRTPELQLLQDKLPITRIEGLMDSRHPYMELLLAAWGYEWVSLILGEASKHWQSDGCVQSYPWYWIYEALCLNAHELVSDAIFLTFQWPALDREYPAVVRNNNVR